MPALAPPAQLPFATTAGVDTGDAMSSQPRVADALEPTLALNTTGHNVFATGPAGACSTPVDDDPAPSSPVAASVPTVGAAGMPTSPSPLQGPAASFAPARGAAHQLPAMTRRP